MNSPVIPPPTESTDTEIIDLLNTYFCEDGFSKVIEGLGKPPDGAIPFDKIYSIARASFFHGIECAFEMTKEDTDQ